MTLLLSLLIFCGAAFAAPESAPQHQAQLVQGAFDSSSDRQSLQRALAKAFGREVRISVENVAAGDGAAGDLFGNSVALSGDTALVGMIGDDTLAGANAGSAYVLTRTGTQWSQQAKLTASDGAAGKSGGGGLGGVEAGGVGGGEGSDGSDSAGGEGGLAVGADDDEVGGAHEREDHEQSDDGDEGRTAILGDYRLSHDSISIISAELQR